MRLLLASLVLLAAAELAASKPAKNLLLPRLKRQNSVSAPTYLYRDINGTSGSIFSYNYPSFYPNNAEWTYVIHTQPGLHTIVLYYNVSIENHPSCVWDSLTFQTDTKICGTQTGRRAYQVYGSDFVIRFTSDSSVQGPGFAIDYIIYNGTGPAGLQNYTSTYNPYETLYSSTYYPYSSSNYPYPYSSTYYPYSSSYYPYPYSSTYYPYSSSYYPYPYSSSNYPYPYSSSNYPYPYSSSYYPYSSSYYPYSSSYYPYPYSSSYYPSYSSSYQPSYSTGYYPGYTSSYTYQPSSSAYPEAPLQEALGDFEVDLNALDRDIDEVRYAIDGVNQQLG